MEISKNSFDIIKKTFDPSYKKTWNGEQGIKQIFLQMYILDKFKNDVYYQPFSTILLFNSGPFLRQSFKIFNFQTYKKDNFETIKKRYLKDYKSTKKRFAFHDMSYHFEADNFGHALLALYDSKTNEIEFFNRGAGEDSDAFIKGFRHFLFKLFSDIYGKTVKINFQQKLCIKTALLKNICPAKYSNIYKHLKGDCVLWILWYLELRLTNKNLSRKQVLSKTLIMLYNDNNDYSNNNHNHLEKPPLVCRIIHGYSKFVDSFRQLYEIEKNSSGNMIRIKKIVKKETLLYKKAERMLKQFMFYINSTLFLKNSI
jgi:hypothetical protein